MNRPNDTQQPAPVPVWRRVPAGWWVTVVLLLLLQGPAGALSTLASQAYGFGVTLLGGEAIFRGVLCQAAPLAGAAACVAFAVRAKWLTFESLWSVVACTAILYASAAIGAEFDRRWGALEGCAHASVERAYPDRVPLADAIGELASWQSLAELYPAGPRPAASPRVEILTESNRPGGVLGVTLLGIEKLLGYLLVYRPRLFLAAVIAGAFVGWRWHARLSRLAERLPAREENQKADARTCRRAA